MYSEVIEVVLAGQLLVLLLEEPWEPNGRDKLMHLR